MAGKHVKTEERFVDDLASVLFTQEGIDRGSQLARARGLDPSLFRFPWVASGSDQTPFERFRIYYPPVIFTDCLYIPVPEIASDPAKPRLAGFDIRYVGEQPHRLRWSKRKRTPETQLIYNAHAALLGDALIVTEGAADAESFRPCGWEAMGALTALKTPRFIHFLHACAKRIYLAFDNDADGQAAASYIMQYSAQAEGDTCRISMLTYPFKDPNESLCRMGREAFKAQIGCQLV